jgi:glutamyl-tRNA synthetase
LFARSAGSSFHLRIEDLDPVPRAAEHEASAIRDLAELGLDWDSVLRQSSRRAAHDAAIERLVEAGLTYPCWCTRAEIHAAVVAPHGPLGVYPGTCRDRPDREVPGRPPALRLRANAEPVAVVDRLHGAHTGVVDDFVLRRGDGTPAYNLAVVVDDAFQGIEEVVRGDDLLESTPRQVLLQRLLGLPTPAYAHVPLVRGPDGERLAKRHGAIGFTPDSFRWIADSLGLVGETPADLVPQFDPARLQVA